MAITKNIGKNTLGDNNKMSVRLHNYEMSTHDLSFVWRNTQSPGTLVPFMKIPAQKGDVFDISLFNKTLTHPTLGPMLGSYKLQHWVFSCPIRLYNSWLHNNRTGIGMKMSQIKIPTIAITGYIEGSSQFTEKGAVSNPSSLAAYLGYKGIRAKTGTTTKPIYQMNAIPYLAYWDIFKNYFANKQENLAYYVSGTSSPREINTGAYYYPLNSTVNGKMSINDRLSVFTGTQPTTQQWRDFWSQLNIYIDKNGTTQTITADRILDSINESSNEINGTKWQQVIGAFTQVTVIKMTSENETLNDTIFGKMKLQSFPLENIDLMRDYLLEKKGNVTTEVQVSGIMPYSTVNNTVTINGEDISGRSRQQYQLAIKTYDSDIFNNWVNTDWIDGTNGINEVTAVDVSDGKLNLDSLNLAQKVYNMLNRIAVSGGSYRDWLETVYTAGNYLERPETPVFEGGMTQYIEFEEVVSQSAAENQPLGTLAGRGHTTNQRGSGKLHIKIQEPSYLIGICAITPMIDYSQGNDWDIINIKTMDDWHKPALDGIGFEDLLDTYKAYWTGEIVNTNQRTETAVGKTVAWINYMTNFNKTFGNFASGESESFMCLNRNYEKTANGENIMDNTTYIDPSKHNEIFADTDINAMNFWLQTACDIKVRRNISAKQIPNL